MDCVVSISVQEKMAFLEKNRDRIQEEFRKLCEEFPEIFSKIEEQIKKYDSETALAICYLYTAMPISDMVNYAFELFAEYAEHGVYLWKNHEEVRMLSEEMFLNYVLLHRVNEEEIRPCRKEFYASLKDRISGYTGERAAVEVNYWCAENVTYQCGDIRTLSAMAIYERGYGRCGEESVFTVNALRSVGIPARQVYVPLWSHCDDNHAWVEAWCDGKWHFLGACEPQPVLNRGWFTEASSRAMLVHARLFGNILPQGEEIVGKEGMVTVFNELTRYAAAQKIEIQVCFPDGSQAAGAEVRFCVPNEAVYGTIALVKADQEGKAELLTGEGSLYIQAKAGIYDGEMMIDTRVQKNYVLQLKETVEDSKWTALDFFAPVDTPVNRVMLSAEQKVECTTRLAKANEIRIKRCKGWENPQKVTFLQKTTEKTIDFYREKLMQQLNQKDHTDCNAEILEAHLLHAMKYAKKFPEEIFVPYILNPRIEFEVFSDWRQALEEACKDHAEEFQKDPASIWAMIDANISERPELERASVLTAPEKAYQYKIASERSKKILYVAIARTFGIPARLNPEDQTMEYWTEHGFQSVLQAESKNTLLTLTNGDGREWKYSRNWAIEKWTEHGYQTLLLNACKWEGQSLNLQIHAGRYRILTTNRLPNGNQFIQQKTIFLKEGEHRTENLYLREANLDDMLEKIQVPEFILANAAGEAVSSYELTKEGKHVMIWIEESCEPTEHILNELMEQKEAFRKWKDQLIFVVRSKEALKDKTLSKALDQLGEIAIYYDTFTENVNMLGRRMYVDPEQLPLVIVFDAGSVGMYAESGYNVGTGNMLLRIFEETH